MTNNLNRIKFVKYSVAPEQIEEKILIIKNLKNYATL